MPQLYLGSWGLRCSSASAPGSIPRSISRRPCRCRRSSAARRAAARSSGLREGLVFVQFLISVTVIACTLVMGAQMRYISSMSLGFERENRVNVTLRGVGHDPERRRDQDAAHARIRTCSACRGRRRTMGGRFAINAIGLENEPGHDRDDDRESHGRGTRLHRRDGPRSSSRAGRRRRGRERGRGRRPAGAPLRGSARSSSTRRSCARCTGRSRSASGSSSGKARRRRRAPSSAS